MCSVMLTIGYTESQPEDRFCGKLALREKLVCKRFPGEYSQEQHLPPVRNEGSKMTGTGRNEMLCIFS